jgi:hypothetical protein
MRSFLADVVEEWTSYKSGDSASAKPFSTSMRYYDIKAAMIDRSDMDTLPPVTATGSKTDSENQKVHCESEYRLQECGSFQP